MSRHFLIAFALVSTAFLAEPRVVCQEVSDQQREIFRAAKTARIVVNESYEHAPGVKLSFEQTTRAILKYVGLSVVGPAEVADVTFQIEATGSPLSRNYQEPSYRRSGIVLYKGAIVRGSLNISAGNAKPIIRSFYGKIDPPATIFDTQIGNSDSPANAPFASAFISGKTTFLDILGQLLTDIYGPSQVATAFIDDHSYVHGIGLEALLQEEPGQAVKISVGAIRDPTTRKAGSAALFTIASKIPKALDPLLDASRDPDPKVRSETMFALAQIKDPRAAAALITAISDTDKWVRISAVNRIAGDYDLRATEPLIRALQDRDPEIRRPVAAALRNAGIKAMEPLIAALKDRDPYVRSAANESLKFITRQQFGEDQKAWRQWWREKKPIYEKADAQMQKYLEMERQRTKPKP